MKETDDTRRVAGIGRPIGVSWGRVGRQILAFILAVALIVVLLEYVRIFAR
jgi:hypothetical protein